MSGNISNLTSWSEKHFDSLCSEVGAISNRSQEDQTGWDFLVELPPDNHAHLPPDLRQIEQTVRVQVKSKEDGKPTSRIKLSNALRYAKSSDPCFLVLILANAGGHPIRIFAKHYWDVLIERTLKRLRENEANGKEPHKSYLTVSFDSADEHTDDLLTWMRERIGSIGPEYTAVKRKIVSSVGYEDGGKSGIITFDSSMVENFIDHTIGLLPDFKPERVQLVDQRFGVKAKKPLFDGRPTYMQMQVEPKPCRLTIRAKDHRVLKLDGEIYASGFLGPNSKVRIKATPIELITKGEYQITITYDFDGKTQHNLKNLRQLARLHSMAQQGPLEFSIASKSSQDLKFEGELPVEKDGGFMRHYEASIEAIQNLADYCDEDAIECSVSEMLKDYKNLFQFAGFILGGRTRIVLDLQSSDPKFQKLMCKSLLLYGHHQIGDWAFLSIIERPTTKDEICDGERVLEFQQPVIVDAIVRQGKVEDFLPDIRSRYKEVLEASQTGTVTLGDGNFTTLPPKKTSHDLVAVTD